MRVGAIHVVALFIGDHLERQFVVIAQKKRPLAKIGNRRGLREDINDGEPVFHPERHEHAWHHWKMESHLTLIPVAKVSDRIFGPLIGFGKQHTISKPLIDLLTKVLQKLVGIREVLAIRTIALVQVWHRVQSHAIHTHSEPKVDDGQQAAPDIGALKIQIRLVMIKPVPVILARNRIPSPVGAFEIFEYDARFFVFIRCVVPYIELARRTSRPRSSGALEPGMLVRGVVEHQLRYHPNAPPVSLAKERSKILHRPV